MRTTTRAATTTLAAIAALAAAPLAGAQGQPPACSVVFVSTGAVEVSLLGTVSVNTPGTSLDVGLGGIAGTLVCGVIGGGGGGVPAPPPVPA
jgi:hypothetical protein